jgi:hypothetical protein
MPHLARKMGSFYLKILFIILVISLTVTPALLILISRHQDNLLARKPIAGEKCNAKAF